VTPRPHQWLYKEYKLFEELGSGGFGVVKKARRLADGKLVVVKEIKTTALNAKLKAAVMDEVENLAKLTHPNIVKYCDCFMDDVYINIVMEYCDSGDLSGMIEARKEKHFDEDAIMFNFVQVCLALHYVHQQGILHRDLKPSNVLVTSSGLLKLGDFGVSKASNVEATMMGRSIVGTPHYLSPEMCDNKPYGKKSDMWALGCILAETCLLTKAFNGSGISGIILKILRGQFPPLPEQYSPELKGLVARLLSPDPAARPYVSELFQMPYMRQHLERYMQWAQGVPDAQPELVAAALAAGDPNRARGLGTPSHSFREKRQHSSSRTSSPRSPAGAAAAAVGSRAPAGPAEAAGESGQREGGAVAAAAAGLGLRGDGALQSEPSRQKLAASVAAQAREVLGKRSNVQSQQQQQPLKQHEEAPLNCRGPLHGQGGHSSAPVSVASAGSDTFLALSAPVPSVRVGAKCLLAQEQLEGLKRLQGLRARLNQRAAAVGGSGGEASRESSGPLSPASVLMSIASMDSETTVLRT